MMKKIVSICVVVIAIVVLGVMVSADSYKSLFEQAGEAYREWQSSDNGISTHSNNNNDIVAIYKDNEITKARVEYEKEVTALFDPAGEPLDDESAIQRIITNIIITEEAERLGLTATQDEIDDMVNMTKEAYELPSGKEMLDEYFNAIGITSEEYFEIVQEQAPNMIARQKLKDAIGMEYCEENNIEFTKINQPEELKAAVNAYINDLFEKEQDNIIYID